MNDVLTLILGGGRGTRLFPLTHMRSKPAVPIGGKYRLIDIPISNCLHAGLKRIFVLTQFNSASLNRHVAQTYRLDMFSDGFVEVLAAEQTPESSDWFQGTADAVRQAARHFVGYDADHYLILAGDHLYRMDFCELIDAHIESGADITIAAQPVDPDRRDRRWASSCSTSAGQISGFEEKPDAARLAEMKSSAPRGAAVGGLTPDKPFVASMGIYVFSRERAARHRCSGPASTSARRSSRPRSARSTCTRTSIAATGPTSAPSRRSTTPTSSSRSAARRSTSSTRTARSTRTRASCRRRAPTTAASTRRSSRRAATSTPARSANSVVGIRTHVGPGREDHALGAARRRLLPGRRRRRGEVPLGIGRNVVLDRVIVDKNARIADGVRLVNDADVRKPTATAGTSATASSWSRRARW